MTNNPFLDDRGAAGTTQQGGTEIRLYHHSPIIYWWVVWAYGFVCAALTYVHGERLVIGEGKPLYIHPSPWLGLSFTILLLVVIVATTVRARGINALLLILLIGASAAGTHFVMNIPGLWTTPPSLLVHMNLAFYLLVSSVLFIIWFAIVFIFDRLRYWRFRATQVERVQKFSSILGRAPESWSVMHIRLTRFSDDLIAHKVLGLGMIGFGTSDIEAKLTIFGGGSEQFRIENVWSGAKQLQAVQALMGPKATVVA